MSERKLTATEARQLTIRGDYGKYLEYYEEEIERTALKGETSVVLSYDSTLTGQQVALQILRERGFTVKDCDAYDNIEIGWAE